MSTKWNKVKNLTEVSESNIEDENYGRWETIARLLVLNLKMLWKSKMIFVMCIVFPLFISLGFSVFLPIWFSWTLIIYVVLLLTTAITFGSLMFTYSTTTMYKNISLTSVRKESTIFSIWAAMMLMGLLSTLGTITSLVVWEQLGIAMTKFSFQDTVAPTVNWNNISWSMVFYYWFVFTSVMFSFSLFIHKFFKTRSNYYMFIMSYLILTIFVGGTMSFTWYVDPNTLEIVFFEKGINPEEGRWYGALGPYLKGEPMYVASQFFPTTHLNEMAFPTILRGMEHTTDDKFNAMIDNVNLIDVFADHGHDWAKLIMFPYINIIFYYVLFRITYKWD